MASGSKRFSFSRIGMESGTGMGVTILRYFVSTRSTVRGCHSDVAGIFVGLLTSWSGNDTGYLTRMQSPMNIARTRAHRAHALQPTRLFPTLMSLMNPTQSAPLTPAPAIQEKHPPGLYALFATELWERFGFYTLGAMLALYLRDPVQGMGWPEQDATTLFSYYLMFVYASPLIGGWLADKWMGHRLAITVGAFSSAPGIFCFMFQLYRHSIWR